MPRLWELLSCAGTSLSVPTLTPQLKTLVWDAVLSEGSGVKLMEPQRLLPER